MAEKLHSANSATFYNSLVSALLRPPAAYGMKDGFYLRGVATAGTTARIDDAMSGVLLAQPAITKLTHQKLLENGIAYITIRDELEADDTQPNYNVFRPGDVNPVVGDLGYFVLQHATRDLGYEPDPSQPLVYQPTKHTVVPDPFADAYLLGIYETLRIQ